MVNDTKGSLGMVLICCSWVMVELASKNKMFYSRQLQDIINFTLHQKMFTFSPENVYNICQQGQYFTFGRR